MMDVLVDNAIDQREALACFLTFELLPNNTKRALKDSRWWTDLHKAKLSIKYVFKNSFLAPQPLQWKHLIDTLIASFFPNHVQPNKNLQMWWGVQQDRQEPHAAFLPWVIKLIETVTGQAVQMWCRED